MYNVLFNYGGMTGQADTHKGIEVIVYHPEKSPDGTHISASSIFSTSMIDNISDKEMEGLLNCLIPSLEACMKDVDKRKELEIKEIAKNESM